MQRGGRATHPARGMAIVVEQTRLKFFAAISAAPGTSSEKKREGRALSLSLVKAACVQTRVICVTLCVIFFRGRIEGRRCAVWSGERGCARRGSRSVLWRGQGAGRERGCCIGGWDGSGGGADQMGVARRGTRPDSSRYVCASCALCKFASESCVSSV